MPRAHRRDMTLIALLAVLAQTDTFSPPPLVDAPAASPAPSLREEPVVLAEPQLEPQTRRLYELAIPGAVMALGGWVGGWVTFFKSFECHSTGWFSVDCESASILLLIPQLGPWLAMTVGGTSDPWFGHNLALGIAQLGGLVAMIAGFSASVPVGDGAVAFNVAPTGNGVALGGTF